MMVLVSLLLASVSGEVVALDEAEEPFTVVAAVALPRPRPS